MQLQIKDELKTKARRAGKALTDVFVSFYGHDSDGSRLLEAYVTVLSDLELLETMGDDDYVDGISEDAAAGEHSGGD